MAKVNLNCQPWGRPFSIWQSIEHTRKQWKCHWFQVPPAAVLFNISDVVFFPLQVYYFWSHLLLITLGNYLYWQVINKVQHQRIDRNWESPKHGPSWHFSWATQEHTSNRRSSVKSDVYIGTNPDVLVLLRVSRHRRNIGRLSFVIR